MIHCCPETKHRGSVYDWTKVIDLMKSCHYQMGQTESRLFSIGISRIISEKKGNVESTISIHSMLRGIYDDDIFIKTALIKAYGAHYQTHHNQCLDVFHSIPDGQKDTVLLGTMMKILIQNNDNDKTLELYDTFQYLMDDRNHVLAIKACASTKNFDRGKRIISALRSSKSFNSNNHCFIVPTVIDFYGKCGRIDLGEKEFNSIDQKNTVTFNSMMTAYVNNGHDQKALDLYQFNESLHDAVSHTMAIKACCNLRDYVTGKALHHKIRNIEHQSVELDNVLIDFYGRCGDPNEAMNIFEGISTSRRSTVSINSIMNVLLDHKQAEQALQIYWRFGKLHDELSHVLAIKATAECSDFESGQEIIERITVKKGQLSNRFKNTMIDFYGNFGHIALAEDVFHSMHGNIDVVTINSMLTMYINNGEHLKALESYQNASQRDDVSHTLAVKACSITNDLQMVDDIVKSLNLEIMSIQLRNSLIDFYGHSGKVETAEMYFNSISDGMKNDFTINTMMNVYNESGKVEETLAIYDRYPILRDSISHMEAIKACIGCNQYERGTTIITNTNDHVRSVQLQNTMIEFYGHFGHILAAEELFKAMDDRKDVISINSLMKAYSINGIDDRALDVYDAHLFMANDVTHLLAIKACTNTKDMDRGSKIHSHLSGDPGIFIKTALIEMYGVCEHTNLSMGIFRSIPDDEMNVVAVNSIMTVLVNNGQNEDALNLYHEYATLQDDVSHLLAIKACTNLADYTEGMRIYKSFANPHFAHSQPLKITLIDFFGNSQITGNMEMCIELFRSIPDDDKDVISINAMMEAFCDNERDQEAINLFENMGAINDRIQPDRVTYSILFKACTQCTLYHVGNEVYRNLKMFPERNKSILNDLSVQINLINMFGKCGMVEQCEEIFNEIMDAEKDIYCTEIGIWNAMMKAYGRNGRADKVQWIWKEMKHGDGIEIAMSTSAYIAVIQAYGHCGKVDDAQRVWEEISDDDVKYDCFTIATLVDCYARSGYLSEAESRIVEYERFTADAIAGVTRDGQSAHKSMWMSLLNGHRQYGDPSGCDRVYSAMEDRFNVDKPVMAAASTILANSHRASSLSI